MEWATYGWCFLQGICEFVKQRRFRSIEVVFGATGPYYRLVAAVRYFCQSIYFENVTTICESIYAFGVRAWLARYLLAEIRDTAVHALCCGSMGEDCCATGPCRLVMCFCGTTSLAPAARYPVSTAAAALP